LKSLFRSSTANRLGNRAPGNNRDLHRAPRLCPARRPKFLKEQFMEYRGYLRPYTGAYWEITPVPGAQPWPFLLRGEFSRVRVDKAIVDAAPGFGGGLVSFYLFDRHSRNGELHASDVKRLTE
jgi:hypothetical protein